MTDKLKIGSTVIITDTTELDSTIKSVCNRSKKLAGEIHQSLVSGMWHAREHGDTTRLTALVSGLHHSARKQGIVAWLNEFMPVTDEGVNAKDGTMKLLKGRKPEDFRIDDAEELPYWDFTEEKVPEEYDLNKLLGALNSAFKKKTCTIPETSQKAILDVVNMQVDLNKANAEAAEPRTGTEG